MCVHMCINIYNFSIWSMTPHPLCSFIRATPRYNTPLLPLHSLITPLAHPHQPLTQSVYYFTSSPLPLYPSTPSGHSYEGPRRKQCPRPPFPVWLHCSWRHYYVPLPGAIPQHVLRPRTQPWPQSWAGRRPYQEQGWDVLMVVMIMVIMLMCFLT